MEQEQLLQRKQLVQAHQLGELQKDYTIRFGKQIAQWGVPGLIALIIFFVLYAGRDVTAASIAIIMVLAVYSTVLGRPLCKEAQPIRVAQTFLSVVLLSLVSSITPPHTLE